MPKRYLHKSVTFDPIKKDEKELWEWLQTLPHGEFSRKTKDFWDSEMYQDKEVDLPQGKIERRSGFVPTVETVPIKMKEEEK